MLQTQVWPLRYYEIVPLLDLASVSKSIVHLDSFTILLASSAREIRHFVIYGRSCLVAGSTLTAFP